MICEKSQGAKCMSRGVNAKPHSAVPFEFDINLTCRPKAKEKQCLLTCRIGSLGGCHCGAEEQGRATLGDVGTRLLPYLIYSCRAEYLKEPPRDTLPVPRARAESVQPQLAHDLRWQDRSTSGQFPRLRKSH